jgi:hypothetical protein
MYAKNMIYFIMQIIRSKNLIELEAVLGLWRTV